MKTSKDDLDEIIKSEEFKLISDEINSLIYDADKNKDYFIKFCIDYKNK